MEDCSRCGLIADWFLFGSASRNSALPNDVDVLCVLEDYSKQGLLFSICEPFLLSAPVHLRVLSRSDERRLGFILKTSAVRLGTPP